MNKLLIGGIYTVGNQKYIFIKEMKHKTAIIFEIISDCNNIKDLEKEIKEMFVTFSPRYLKTKFIRYPISTFLKCYDGFMGTIEPCLMDKIVKLRES